MINSRRASGSWLNCLGEEVNWYKWNIFQDAVLSVCAFPISPLEQRQECLANRAADRQGRPRGSVEAQSPSVSLNVIQTLNVYVRSINVTN